MSNQHEEGTGSMTLWVECEHGELVEHDVRDPAGFLVEPWRCPGGRQATPEDVIEALGGEKVVVIKAEQCPGYAGLDSDDKCALCHNSGKLYPKSLVDRLRDRPIIRSGFTVSEEDGRSRFRSLSEEEAVAVLDALTALGQEKQ